MSADTELEGLDPELEAILAKDDTEIMLDELRELFGADLDVDSRFTIAQVITAMERSFENGKAHIEMVERCKARAALDASGIGEMVAENERLKVLLNTPEVDDWAKGVTLEAGHQRERWGVDHDAGKTPFDWFWLVGYLAQKAAASAVAGDVEKAKHHTISTGAALANWHLALCGTDTRMRPGIDPDREQAA